MSLFLLPVAVCDGIEKKMNGFWWGLGLNGKGIRWMSWEKLCPPKFGGGLGSEVSRFLILLCSLSRDDEY